MRDGDRASNLRIVAETWEEVSWDDFRKFCGKDLRCFDADSRWIPRHLFRAYFAERGVTSGRAFVRIYSEQKHKHRSGSLLNFAS